MPEKTSYENLDQLPGGHMQLNGRKKKVPQKGPFAQTEKDPKICP